MNGFTKSREKELREIWEKCGWLIFRKFEDYLAEVRKVELDLQDGTITMEKLKEENDHMIHQLQEKFSPNEQIEP